MSRIAFVFPGQGAQYFGMGKNFDEQCEASRAVYDEASRLLNMDMRTLCFEENEQLNMTEYTQIGLLTTELAMLEAVRTLGIVPEVTAGLSLGEYAAIVACRKMRREDAIMAVRHRGMLMQEAVPTGGAMAAVLGLDNEKVEAVCEQTEGLVEPANYNCPGQMVISGEVNAVEAAAEAMKAAGAKRVAMLNVSGPFHSSMLKEAGMKLNDILSDVELQDSSIPYVSNTTAKYIEAKDSIKELLVRQIYSSVKWEQSIRRMIASGIDTFVEVGPGKTLSGFLKRIDKTVKSINIDKYEDLAKLSELGGQ